MNRIGKWCYFQNDTGFSMYGMVMYEILPKVYLLNTGLVVHEEWFVEFEDD